MKNPLLHFWILFITLASTGLYTTFLSSVQSTSLNRELKYFPEQIGTFHKLKDTFFDQEVVDTAGMDQYLMRTYIDKEGYPINLYIGYYRYQNEGHIIHSPKNCMPGSGWEFTQENKKRVVNPATGNPAYVNQAILQKVTEKQLAYYWNQGRGRIIGNEYTDRAYLIIDSILRRKSNGALIRIIGPVDNLENAIEKQEAFINNLLPILNEYIPN